MECGAIITVVRYVNNKNPISVFVAMKQKQKKRPFFSFCASWKKSQLKIIAEFAIKVI